VKGCSECGNEIPTATKSGEFLETVGELFATHGLCCAELIVE